MVDPLFWLGLSILLVAVSIAAVLMTALPAFRELARAARSAEKLFDTLHRELPPTLEAIRLTSLEITELTDDMTEGVQNVGRMTQQMDEGVTGVRQQAKQAQITTRSVMAGFKAAVGALVRPQERSRSDRAQPVPRPSLPASSLEALEAAEPNGIAFDAADPGMLETESVSLADQSHTVHTKQIAAQEAAGEAVEKAIAPTESNDAQAVLRNGNPHPPQLRAASSLPINVPPAAPEKPLSVESRQQRQS